MYIEKICESISNLFWRLAPIFFTCIAIACVSIWKIKLEFSWVSKGSLFPALGTLSLYIAICVFLVNSKRNKSPKYQALFLWYQSYKPYLKYLFFILAIGIISASVIIINNQIPNALSLLSAYISPIILIFCALGLFIFILEKEPSSLKTTVAPKEPAPSGRYYSAILVVLIIALGIALRLHNISHLSVWYDEGLTITTARNMAEGSGNLLASGFIYERAKIFHEYLSLFYEHSNNLEIGVYANIPFFILTSIVIFLFGKELSGRTTGIIACFLFAFSWPAIAIFREIRFYEIYLSFFLLSAYYFYKVYLLYSEETKEKSKIKPLIIYITGFITSFGVAITTQELTFFMLYALLLFGIILILKSNRIGYFITSTTSLAILIADIFKFNSWRVDSALMPSMPEWFTNFYSKSHYLDFFNYLTHNDYPYLPILLLVFLGLVIYRSKREEIFLTSMIIGLYSTVSNQGVGYPELIRYYYFIFPFIFLAVAYLLVSLINIKKYRAIGLLCILVISLATIKSGFLESRSPESLSSKYENRNLPYADIAKLISGADFSNYIVIGDNLSTFVLSLYTTRSVNYFLDRKPDLRISGIERNTQTPEITYMDLVQFINSGQRVLFIDDERRFRELRGYLNALTGGKEIYTRTVNSSGDRIRIVEFGN